MKPQQKLPPTPTGSPQDHSREAGFSEKGSAWKEVRRGWGGGGVADEPNALEVSTFLKLTPKGCSQPGLGPNPQGDNPSLMRAVRT